MTKKATFSFTDKFKEILPGVIVSLIISTITSAIVFSTTFSTLQANVIYNNEQIKLKVGREQFDAILSGQEKIAQNFDKRLDKIENKLDRIIEKGNK